MRKSALMLVIALSVMVIGATAIATIGQGQTQMQSNKQLATAWPTVVYMTSNQTYFLSNQTPCSIDNNMTGMVTFWPSQDNSTVFYTAWFSGTDNITQIAFHIKQSGEVGGAVVYLYAPGIMTRAVTVVNQTSGLMVVGNYTASNLVGSMSNKSMSDLNALINTGNISVIASPSKCPMALRGEFGVFPFVVCNCQGANQTQVTTPSGQTPQVQTPQGYYGPCQGGYCGPMGPGMHEPYTPMGPRMMGPNR